mmetsp:Transcript_32553/g.75278  ORF Transcript_32553/g.75278 Transcript_32553/m.75278 type:complete len:222 (-) Transcript_32553:140-805(-)
MAWVNNNKRNARFNPNRRDDRLLDAEVTARRHPRPQKPAEEEDSESEELINTDPEFVLSMESDSRVDWLQMALMQAAEGKLKAAALYEVMKHKAFVPSEASHRSKLKAMLTANLHLFNPKHKKVLEEAISNWGSDGSKKKERRASSSSSSSRKRKKEAKESAKTSGADRKNKRSSSSDTSSKPARKSGKKEAKDKKKRSSSTSASRKKRSRSRSKGRRKRS